MTTQQPDKTPESIRVAMNDLLAQFAKVPIKSTHDDMAAAIDLLGDLEKMARQRRKAWTAAILEAARQRNLT